MTMKRTIESIKENEVIHCPTEELAVKFCQMLKNAGKKWCDGTSYDDPYWDGKSTCYDPTKGDMSSVSYCKGLNYTIIPATDFIITKPDTFYVTSDSTILMKAWWEEMKKMGYYANTEMDNDTDWKGINTNLVEPNTRNEWLSMYISCPLCPNDERTIHFTLPADFNKSIDYARQALEYWPEDTSTFIEWLKIQPAYKIVGSELYNQYKIEQQ